MLFEIAVVFVLACALIAGWYVTQDVADERVAMRKRIPRWLVTFALRWYGVVSGVVVAVILALGVGAPALVAVVALNFLVGALHDKRPVLAVLTQVGAALVVGAILVALTLRAISA